MFGVLDIDLNTIQKRTVGESLPPLYFSLKSPFFYPCFLPFLCYNSRTQKREFSQKPDV